MVESDLSKIIESLYYWQTPNDFVTKADFLRERLGIQALFKRARSFAKPT